MASDNRTPEQLRTQLETEREQLAAAVDELREGMSEATNVSAKLEANLPAVAAGALAGGFLLAGGIGATARLIFRRGREGKEAARVGRFTIFARD